MVVKCFALVWFDMKKCVKCGKTLTNDEIALHRRLLDFESKEFFCIFCIAEYFDCSVDIMKNKIIHFKNLGCELFEKSDDNNY